MVHPSYIDNSPNSICEAQYLGVPVIATNVRGIPTLVKDRETGLPIPANAPYHLASKFKTLMGDPLMQQFFGQNALRIAHSRHNHETIKSTLVGIYRQILQEERTDYLVNP